MTDSTLSVAAEDVGAFDRNGVFVVRRLLEDTDVESLRAAVDEAGSSIADQRGGKVLGFWNRSHLVHTSSSVRRILLGNALGQAVAAALGTTRLWLYEDTALVKEPGDDPGTPWHQDLVHYPVVGRHVATAWISLDAVDGTNGAVHYVAGSHRWGRRFEPVAFADGRRFPATGFEPVPTIDATTTDFFETAPGDVIIHHGLILHGSPAGTVLRRRRALAATYLGEDAVVGVTPFPHDHPIAHALPAVGMPLQYLLPQAQTH